MYFFFIPPRLLQHCLQDMSVHACPSYFSLLCTVRSSHNAEHCRAEQCVYHYGLTVPLKQSSKSACDDGPTPKPQTLDTDITRKWLFMESHKQWKVVHSCLNDGNVSTFFFSIWIMLTRTDSLACSFNQRTSSNYITSSSQISPRTKMAHHPSNTT